MRPLRDTTHALDAGLGEIRRQYSIPDAFPAAVDAAAATASRREPTEHRDLTDWPFVTLDPATSTDLDQAFHIERAGNDLLLHYAIADVAWFVADGDVVDQEAWTRGLTLYLPDGRAPLYPPVLTEGAASLLPDGPRPAVVFHVRIGTEGVATLDGATRAVVRSRAKLAYDSVTSADLPVEFDELSHRIEAAAATRGAGVVEPPEQVVVRDDGHYRLEFRPRLESESQNAALSLSANLAIASMMVTAGVGLFRVMSPPGEQAIRRLRHTAHSLALHWPDDQPLDAFVRGLDANSPRHAAFMLAVRRAGGGASYVAAAEGLVPWHAAMAAPYAHATAPLRRLADRYTVMATLALASGAEVDEATRAALERLPAAMGHAEARANQVDHAVLDLAEAVMLHGREGDVFDAVVVDDDDETSRLHLPDVAVVVNVRMRHVQPGDAVKVRLVSADPSRREVRFERVA